MTRQKDLVINWMWRWGSGRGGRVKDKPKFWTWELSGRGYHLLRWGTWMRMRRFMEKGGCYDESSFCDICAISMRRCPVDSWIY